MEKLRLYIEEFGYVPDSGTDLVPPMLAALERARECNGECEIIFPFGRYDAFCDALQTKDIYVSNTDSGEDETDIDRKFAFLLENCENITLNGCGSTVVFHGQMTLLGILNSRNITVKNFIFDMKTPTLAEMTVTDIGADYLDCAVLRGCPYRIRDGKIEWYGENFAFSSGTSQVFDPESGLTWRAFSPLADENAVFEELSPGKVRLHFKPGTDGKNPYEAKVGFVFQMRDPYRDDCGILVSDSKNIRFQNMTVHYMHEMGLMVQNSEDIFTDGFNCLPGVGRTASVSSDIMHFSGCRGTVRIENGCFVGAHDDAINIHGTHLQVMKNENGFLTLRFMHKQTFGIGGFRVGDRIAAIDPETLLTDGTAVVKAVQELSPRKLLLELDSPTPAFSAGTAVENLYASPDVVIKNNSFFRIPTRGILVTSRGRVQIKNNLFSDIKMCGILIADDAGSWFESGGVENVTVSGNVFRRSGGPFMEIKPENKRHAGAVHKNISVTGNTIFFPKNSDKMYSMLCPWMEKQNNVILKAKSTDGITFCDNEIIGEEDTCVLSFLNCGGVCVSHNRFNGEIKTEERNGEYVEE